MPTSPSVCWPRIPLRSAKELADRRRLSAESLGVILAALNSNRPLNDILQGIAGHARQVLASDAVAIYHNEATSDDLIMVAADGLTLNAVLDKASPMAQTILRQAIAARKLVAVPDTRTLGETERLSRYLARTACRTPRLYSGLLAVPLFAQNEAYGGTLYYYRGAHPFADYELELAQTFGSKIVLAIENAQLRDQLAQAAASAERSRLARDLHDAVTQTLFSASVIAEALPRIWDKNPDEGRNGLQELRQLTRGALAEMRTLLLELRPAALTEKPLGELLGHLADAFVGRTRVPVDLRVSGDERGPATCSQDRLLSHRAGSPQ